MKALIDGDILIYRVGFSAQNDGLRVAQYKMDEWVDKIVNAVGADSYEFYLSDSAGNFREQIYPEYKSNRKQPKPRHYEELINYCLDKHRAFVAWGQEADDALGIEQSNPANQHGGTVICTIDKDLKQIPGSQYDFLSDELTYITARQGLEFFYQQLILGDGTDNIPGYDGKCRNKCPQFIQPLLDHIVGCLDEAEMFRYVRAAYISATPTGLEEVDSIILRNGRLLKIRTYTDELWEFPK